MITGVGNVQFMWMYAIGFGILRAPEAFAYSFWTVRHARMDFEVAWGDFCSVFSPCNFYSPASFVVLGSFSPRSFP